jgi:hypothetical protein
LEEGWSRDDAALLALTFWVGVESKAFPAFAWAVLGLPPPYPSCAVAASAALLAAAAAVAFWVVTASMAMSDTAASGAVAASVVILADAAIVASLAVVTSVAFLANVADVTTASLTVVADPSPSEPLDPADVVAFFAATFGSGCGVVAFFGACCPASTPLPPRL